METKRIADHESAASVPETMLLDCYMELIAYTGYLVKQAANDAPAHKGVAKVYEDLVERSRSFALSTGYSENDWLEGLFPVCAYIDETLLCSDGLDHAQWERDQLQRKCFNTTAAGRSSLVDANDAYHKLKTMMVGRTEFPAVWDLVLGPRNFLMTFAAAQASCFLQDQWQEQVLSYLQEVDPDKIPHLLFAKQEGLVWKFLDSTAEPFIARNQSGYVPRKDFRGRILPFRAEFIHLLNQGEKAVIDYQPDYKIDFETVPLQVNDGAKTEPYAAILKANCTDNKFILENFNYPLRATFHWSPSKCGDTLLSIAFPDFKLHKHYKGSLGFARFLKDFKDGSHSFPADAFPGRMDDLKKIGVSSITLSYKISGGQAVVQLLNREPSLIPEKIIVCGYH